MKNDHAGVQPLGQILSTGTIGIALVLVIAAAFIAPFEHNFFVNWVAMAFMAATPTQIILGLLWQNSKPDFVNGLQQPVKGIVLTGITLVMGAIVLALILALVSKGHGITPMVIQFTIMTVVSVLWLVPIWQCWPMKILTKDPFLCGVLTLLFAYLLAYVLWTIFFDYSILSKIGHAHYYAEVDPGGMFDMWVAMTFFVTTAGVIIVHVLFDFWPIEKLSFGSHQPVRGVIATLYILALSWLIRTLFVDGLGMEQVEYMIRVPVCMIFGTFLVNNMMQHALFANLVQPLRGLVLLLLTVFVALMVYELYSFALTLHLGKDLGMGPQNGFAKEIWIASAMLGITFPIIFMVSGFFAFWPIKRSVKE